MKKIIYSYFIFWGVFSFSWGNPIEFGLKGGINLSSETNLNNQSEEVGVIGGFYLGLPLSDFLSFQPELDYSMKGSHFQYQAQYENTPWGYLMVSPSFTGNERLNYLEMPILLKASTVLGSNLKLSLLGGPSGALFLFGQDTLTSVGPSTSFLATSPSSPLSVHQSTFDFDLVFGVEGEFENFILDARWSMGLTPLYEYANGKESMNNVISFQGGYRIF